MIQERISNADAFSHAPLYLRPGIPRSRPLPPQDIMGGNEKHGREINPALFLRIPLWCSKPYCLATALPVLIKKFKGLEIDFSMDCLLSLSCRSARAGC